VCSFGAAKEPRTRRCSQGPLSELEESFGIGAQSFLGPQGSSLAQWAGQAHRCAWGSQAVSGVAGAHFMRRVNASAIWSLSGAKRTSRGYRGNEAIDPKRTSCEFAVRTAVETTAAEDQRGQSANSASPGDSVRLTRATSLVTGTKISAVASPKKVSYSITTVQFLYLRSKRHGTVGIAMEPDEDLQALLDKVALSKSLDYAFLRIGELDPDVGLGAVESDEAKIQEGQSWWERHKDEVKQFVCQNKTIRIEGPLTIVQAIFGVLAQIFGGPIATYATVILIKKQFAKPINDLTKDAIDAWCGDIRPPEASRTAPVAKRKPAGKSRKTKKA
jgi:hypothetical protein